MAQKMQRKSSWECGSGTALVTTVLWELDPFPHQEWGGLGRVQQPSRPQARIRGESKTENKKNEP